MVTGISDVYMAAVEKIVTALSELEKDIDILSMKVQDMKKRILTNSDKEISQLREKVIGVARTESEKIIATAKKEAEEKSQKILQDAEINLTKLKENTKLSFDKSVNVVVDSVLNKVYTISQLNFRKQHSKNLIIIKTNVILNGKPLEIKQSSNQIVVATVEGRPYYKIVSMLKAMNISFSSLSPEEASRTNAKIIITTKNEA